MSLLKDFECPICFKLLFRPVTTVCGHNFCKACVDQVTAYSSKCPICRAALCMEYAPNTLLMQAITELFVNEVREREAENLATAQAEEARFRRRCGEQRFDGEGYLPVLYCNRRNPPMFRGEETSFVMRTSDVTQLLQFSMSRGGMLLVLCDDGQNTQYGALAKIVNTELGNASADDHTPFTVRAKGVERVESVGTAVSSGHGWFTSMYRIMRDDFIFPYSQEQNESEALIRLQHAVTQKSISRESLVPEFNDTKVLAGKALTDMDRYRLCCQLLQLCAIIARRQLQDCSAGARRLFTSQFSNLMVVGDDPTSEEVEATSLFYARLVVASNDEKWRWYTMRDPLTRLVEVADIFVHAGDSCVLQLQANPTYKLGIFWSTLLLLVAAVLLSKVLRR